MTATVFILLALFGIKHFIADFLMQFDYMLREKGIYGAIGGVHHALVHASWTFLILVFFCSSADEIIALSFADFVLHYHIDYFKQKLNKGLTTADRMFWVWLGADQALHYLTYVGIISYVTLS
jgi:Protein of unknown function (DUF3307)